MSEPGVEEPPVASPPLGSEPPRAAAFIVTIYGDVVEPRGGVLWMGSLIEICADFGITETLVRTAVSRLVEAGQLAGERDGRRSFYRLTDSARIEFAIAAQALFAPSPAHNNWLFVQRPPAKLEPALVRDGFVAVGPDLLMGPDRHRSIALPGLTFRAEILEGTEALPAFAAQYWDLDGHARAYEAFISRFQPLASALQKGAEMSDHDCLISRLALVHAYRAVLLRDPRLPPAALPQDWPGTAAGTLFATLYQLLSPPANSYIGSHLSGGRELLPPETEATRKRLVTLTAMFDMSQNS